MRYYKYFVFQMAVLDINSFSKKWQKRNLMELESYLSIHYYEILIS